MLERADRWDDVRHQTRQRAHVVLAVVQNIPLLLVGERRTLEDAIAHVLLVGDVDLVLTEIAKRTADAEETLSRAPRS